MGDFTIFWKIVVEPCNDSISVYKKFELWEKIAQKWSRIAEERIDFKEADMTMKIHGDVIFINDNCGGYIQFNGGYIEVTDEGLAKQISKWLPDIDTTNLDPSSIFPQLISNDADAFIEKMIPNVGLGKNIQIEANISVNAGNTSSTIFYHPQLGKDAAVILTEKQIQAQGVFLRRIDWQISSTTYESDGFFLSDMHQLIVNHDRDYAVDDINAIATAVDDVAVSVENTVIAATDTVNEATAATTQINNIINNLPNIIQLLSANIKNTISSVQNKVLNTETSSRNTKTEATSIDINTIKTTVDTAQIAAQTRFEAFVGTIPLTLFPLGADDTHLFSLEEVTFFIGYNPKEMIRFQGKIKRIVFDPNISCTAC